jgi:endonuclease YncB( thermonuclease family)
MAWVFVRYVPAGSSLHAVEAEARAARRGLWATAQPVPPWVWRDRRALSALKSRFGPRRIPVRLAQTI